MPKKTKKAKLIAEYRRKLQQLEGVSSIDDHTVVKQPVQSVFTLPLVKHQEEPTTTLLLPKEESFAIKKDLLKTLIVVTMFIVFELFLATVVR